MTELGKEKIEDLIKGMSLDQQQYALQFIRTELLWNETERRLKDALEYKERLKKAASEG